MSATAEIQAATLQEFIQGWRKFTPEDFLVSWSNDCTQMALPLSPEKPVRSRPELEHLFPILMSTLTNFQASEH